MPFCWLRLVSFLFLLSEKEGFTNDSMSHTSACEHKSRPGRATRQRKARKMQEETAAPCRGKGSSPPHSTFDDHLLILIDLVVRDARYDRYLNWLREHNFPKAKLVLAEFPGAFLMNMCNAM